MATSHSYQMPVSLSQIIELVKQLPKEQKNKLMRLLKKDVEEDFVVPEWHKKIVMEREKKSDPKKMMDWNKVKNSFKS